eukprot:TRINITY_DN15827_c0_g1_i1.p1 TRINITY_DN15827_c0_g1~~TRINITY_DN15827_c0_g1_i1.p1  ORF type:complete len:115 (+),score=10.98 TRINITY_DN15827_c0_g1_i1:304-648(+)
MPDEIIHQCRPSRINNNPLIADIRAQNLVIREQNELIRKLRRQLQEKKALVPPPRRGQTPSVEQDLRQILSNKTRNRAYDEGSSSSHLKEDSKRSCQRPKDIDDLREWLDRQVK